MAWYNVYVRRYPHTWFDQDDDGILAFVAWRYHISLALAGRARRRFHWLQDMPGSNVAQLAASPGFVARTDAFFCLSRFHLARQTFSRSIFTALGLRVGHNRPAQDP